MKTLIIIPAHNEGANIENTVADLVQHCPNIDYIIVNDGSTDNTERICRQNNYPLINLPVNLGLAGAFRTGMKYADKYKYDSAIQFDGDGQHEAEYISIMQDRMAKTKADVIIGSRYCEKEKPATLRMFGSRLITLSIWLTTGTKITDPTSGMRLYGRKMIKRFATQINFGPEPDTIALLLRSGIHVEEQQVEMRERSAGASYLTLGKSLKYMMNMCISILFIQFFRGEKS